MSSKRKTSLPKFKLNIKLEKRGDLNYFKCGIIVV